MTDRHIPSNDILDVDIDDNDGDSYYYNMLILMIMLVMRKKELQCTCVGPVSSLGEIYVRSNYAKASHLIHSDAYCFKTGLQQQKPN